MQGGVCAFCSGVVVKNVCNTKEKLSAGAIAGIVIGVIVFLGAVVGGIWYCLMLRNKR